MTYFTFQWICLSIEVKWFCFLLRFALKNILVLLARRDSGELRCHTTAPIRLTNCNPIEFCQQNIWRTTWAMVMIFGSKWIYKTMNIYYFSCARIKWYQCACLWVHPGLRRMFAEWSYFRNHQLYVPRHVKTYLRGVRPGKTQTGLLRFRDLLVLKFRI